jgi:hypothetical protein
MIQGTPTPGRPIYKAVLPYDRDNLLELQTTFQRIAVRLRYREIVGLARTLGVHQCTVYAWHYGKRCPDFNTMLTIIQWDKDGKRVEKHYQPTNSPYKGMF